MLRVLLVWWLIAFARAIEFDRVAAEPMKCSYGERGSLTATCVNATPGYFKATSYRFDHLDQTLICLNCTLTNIESNTFDLAGNTIKDLELSNCRIETLKPKSFMGLIFMEKLNLANNKIRSIFPGTFTGTKKIEWLDLSNNQITILSEEGFKELTSLQELHLNKNSIKTIDLYAFKGLDKLQILDLSYNYISVVNDSLKNLTAMEYLNLRHNDLHRLNGDEFFQMAQLSKLDLSENQLDDRFSLNMTYDNQLLELLLSHNQIQHLWFNLSHLDNLQILDLSYNNVSAINATRNGRLSSLQNLNLAYNNLKVWKTGQFTGLPQLHEINCTHNQIETVAITGVFLLPTLHTLDLSYNLISDLDYFSLLSRLPSLAYLKLSSNLLSCDLEQEMEKSFSEDNFKYELYDDVVGGKKCVKKPLLPAHRLLHEADAYVATPQDSLSASDIVMFVLISLVIAAISVLAYVQYLFYKGVQVSLPGRADSNLRLINSEPEQREEEFVNALS